MTPWGDCKEGGNCGENGCGRSIWWKGNRQKGKKPLLVLMNKLWEYRGGGGEGSAGLDIENEIPWFAGFFLSLSPSPSTWSNCEDCSRRIVRFVKHFGLNELIGVKWMGKKKTLFKERKVLIFKWSSISTLPIYPFLVHILQSQKKQNVNISKKRESKL
jgi:hypothetical protein